MSLYVQVPVYAYIFSNVLKMATKADKENPLQNPKVPRSKIPVMTTCPGLTKKPRTDKANLLGDRQPLGSIQAHDGGVAGEFNRVIKVRKSELPFANEKMETRVRHVSPQGSVYRLVKCKTTTTVKKEEHKYLKDRHVTIRKDSPLDWRYKVFQNSAKDEHLEKVAPKAYNVGNWTTVLLGQLGDNTLPLKRSPIEEKQNEPAPEQPISLQLAPSDTDLVPTRLNERRSKSAERPVRISKAITPTYEPIALHNRVKKIKRSLKRPSSRELQTRTSSEADIQAQTETQAQTFQVSTEPSPFLKKDLAFRLVEFGPIDHIAEIAEYSRNLTIPYERSIISYLKAACEELKRQHCITSAQRALVVNWLVKINGLQGDVSGGPQVLQVAVRHLDRVLSQAVVPVERVQLLAAASYWLAQKQCAKPRSATAFVRHAANAFAPDDLRAAERYVLRKLNWPAIPVVADDFVPYLVQLCSLCRPEPLTAAATFFCSVALLDASLSSYTPDVLALAAVLNSAKLLERISDVDVLQDCVLHRSLKSSRLQPAMLQMMSIMIQMQDESFRCREPFMQFSRPPHCIAPRLAAAASAIADSRCRNNMNEI